MPNIYAAGGLYPQPKGAPQFEFIKSPDGKIYVADENTRQNLRDLTEQYAGIYRIDQPEQIATLRNSQIDETVKCPWRVAITNENMDAIRNGTRFIPCTNFIATVKFSGEIQYKVTAYGRSDAMVRAEEIAEFENKTGMLHDISWKITGVHRFAYNRYSITIQYSGTFEYKIAADTEPDASKIAGEFAAKEKRFGKLTDIKWEIQNIQEFRR